MSEQMQLNRPASAWRSLGIVVVLSMGLVLAWWWWAPHLAPHHREPAAAASMAAEPASVASASLADASSPEGGARPPGDTLQPREGEVLARDLMAQYRSSRGSVDSRYKGQRLRVLGRILQLEQADSGMIMVSLQAEEELHPLRVVMASDMAAGQDLLSEGRALVLDCQHQGMLMGDPVLAARRVFR